MRASSKLSAAWVSVILTLMILFSRSAECAQDGGGSLDDVDIIDSNLDGKLAIQRVGSEASKTGLLSVFVGLRNKTGKTLNIQVETIYKSRDGEPVNAGSWVTLSLQPHEEKEYRSTSISIRYDPNLMDANFLVRIRHAAPVVPPIPVLNR